MSFKKEKIIRKFLFILFLIIPVFSYSLDNIYFQEIKTIEEKNKKIEHFLMYIKEETEDYSGYEVIRETSKNKESVYMRPIIDTKWKYIYDKILEKEKVFGIGEKLKMEYVKSYGLNLKEDVYIMLIPIKEIRKSYKYEKNGELKEIKVEKMFNRITDDKREVGNSEKERKILSGLGYGELLEINKAEEDGIIFNYDMKDNVYIKTYIK